MKQEEFLALTTQIEKLTPHQRTLLAERLDTLANVQAVNALVESRVLAAPRRPRCRNNKIARWGALLDCSATAVWRARPHSTR